MQAAKDRRQLTAKGSIFCPIEVFEQGLGLPHIVSPARIIDT